MTALVKAVCLSRMKGEVKTPVPEAEIRAGHGLVGDAHAGEGLRQVSLLAQESVDKMKTLAPELKPGAFAENILTEGLNLCELPVGTRLRVGRAVLEVTQIGKECHAGCAIRRLTGDCVMPREGVFAIALQGGIIRAGDEAEILGPAYTAAVITVSDKCSRGLREDLAGPLVRSMLEEAGFKVVHTALAPDERAEIARELVACAELDLALAVTTGGTGLSPRDVTPEATLEVCERLTPGLPEVMRAESLKITERGALSRQQAGIRGRTWIINLPGSPKAARENLAAILPSLAHGLQMLRNPPMDHD